MLPQEPSSVTLKNPVIAPAESLPELQEFRLNLCSNLKPRLQAHPSAQRLDHVQGRDTRHDREWVAPRTLCES